METQEIKLTEQEINQLLEIKQVKSNITLEFGKINILELELETRKQNTKNYYTALLSQEAELSKLLQDKYGKGIVDIDTGVFKPTK